MAAAAATRVSVGPCTLGIEVRDGTGGETVNRGGGSGGSGGPAREGPKGVGHLFPSRTA